MCRSITTASGATRRRARSRASPSRRPPTTASSGWRSISGRSESRKGSSSSASSTLIAPSPPGLPHRDRKQASWVACNHVQKVAVIGAALDLGAGRRGVDMGPSAIRYAGLERAAGRARPRRASISGTSRPTVAGGDRRGRRARAFPARRSRRPASAIAELVAQARMRRARCRSCSAATTRSRSARSAGSPAHGPGGVIWLDAHGDLNRPETTPSGNVHGMVLAAALGLAGDDVRERRLADCRRSIRARVALVGVALARRRRA